MVRVDSKLAISRWKREDRFFLRAYYYVLIPFLGLNNLLEEITSGYGVWNQRINSAASHWLTGRRHIGSPGCQERVDVKRKRPLAEEALLLKQREKVRLYIPKRYIHKKRPFIVNFHEKHRQVIHSATHKFTF